MASQEFLDSKTIRITVERHINTVFDALTTNLAQSIGYLLSRDWMDAYREVYQGTRQPRNFIVEKQYRPNIWVSLCDEIGVYTLSLSIMTDDTDKTKTPEPISDNVTYYITLKRPRANQTTIEIIPISGHYTDLKEIRLLLDRVLNGELDEYLDRIFPGDHFKLVETLPVYCKSYLK